MSGGMPSQKCNKRWKKSKQQTSPVTKGSGINAARGWGAEGHIQQTVFTPEFQICGQFLTHCVHTSFVVRMVSCGIFREELETIVWLVGTQTDFAESTAPRGLALLTKYIKLIVAGHGNTISPWEYYISVGILYLRGNTISPHYIINVVRSFKIYIF